jgi:putative ABC transport system permease protein
MTSALVRKSVTDLTRRKGRTFFTVSTLALAVASVGFLAPAALIDTAMQEEVRAGQLADVRLWLEPVELSAGDLAAVAAVPNVAAAEPRSSVDVRVVVGDRRAPARVIGVRDFAHQEVNVARVESGAFPTDGELLADVQDANVGVFDGEAGDPVTVLGPTLGAQGVEYVVSGRGRTLPGGEIVQDDSIIVFYADAETVADLSGQAGYTELALRLDDAGPKAARETIEDVRAALASVPAFEGFTYLPDIRAPGDWPGRTDTEDFGKFVSVITVLALLSALVLIANTMGTLVAEQNREIAVMRAIGASRRGIARIYVTTTLLLAAVGTVVGVFLGFLLSNLMAGYFGATFWAVDVPWGIDAPVLTASIVLGLLLPPLASLPAVRRGLRVDLRQGLEAGGADLGPEGRVDHALRHAGFLPRVAQIGLRNVGRRKRRTVATALIVALAVGNLLAVMALSVAATEATQTSWGDHLEDVQIWSAGADPFDAGAERIIRATPGVAEAEPVLKTSVEVDGREASIWAVEADPLFRYQIADGRWFSPGEEQAGERVAVVERNLADLNGVDVGDRVAVTTAAGAVELDVIGVSTNQQEDGLALFVPLGTARSLLGETDGSGSYWIKTESSDDTALVDRTTTALEDRLSAQGYEVGTEIRYVAEREEVAANRNLTTTIAVLGFVVVVMSMVGLANAMTTNIFERTREVGILRCVGARARDVRRIFTTEGLVLAVSGWLVGIPLGYLLTRMLVRLVWEVADVRLPFAFPAAHLLVAFVGTVALALAVLHLPVRRAVRLRPGDALRYG